MRSFIYGIIISFLIAGNSLAQTDSLKITFKVDLSVQQEIGFFNPADYTPKIAGSFTDWQNSAVDLVLDTDTVYSATFLFEDVSPDSILQYKFILVDAGGGIAWEKNFSTGSNNREYSVTGSESDSDLDGIADTTVTYFFNDLSPSGLVVPSPATAAANPTEPEDRVISVYSNQYDNVIIDTYRTIWSQASFVPFDISGNDIIKYVQLDFVGIETVENQLDISSMTNLRFDLWTSNATTFRVKLVDFGPDGVFGNDDSEHEIVFENPSQGVWNNIDIPLSDFTTLSSTQNIAQIIFSGVPVGEVNAFIDNIYFYGPESPFAKPPYAIGDTLNYDGSFAGFDLGTGVSGGTGWFFDNVNGPSTYDIVNDSQDGDGKAVKANINFDGSPDIWRAQIVNEPINVAEGDLIKATFWMKADSDGKYAEAFFGLPEAGSFEDVTTYGFNISSDWTYYELEYYTNSFDAEVGLRFGVKLNFEQNADAMIFLDNVQVIKQEAILTDVTFSVNLGVQTDLGNFSPDSISAGVVGSVNGWDTGNPIMLSAQNDSVYSGSAQMINVNIGDTLRYKFILKEEATGRFEWESPDPTNPNTAGEFYDRVATIDNLTETVIPTVFMHDIDRADQDPDNYGITSITDARNAPEFSHLATQGIITKITYNFLYLQNGDVATMVFRRPFFSDQNSLGFDKAIRDGEIQVGDDLKIAGVTGDFNGLHQLLKIHAWEVVSSGNSLPEYQVISINEFSNNGEAYESELVRVEFIRLDEPADTLKGGFIYEITNLDSTENGWIGIQGANNNEWADQVAPEGYFTFEGVLKEFFIPSIDDNIYAITPHHLSDIKLESVSDAVLEIPSFAGLLGETFSYPVWLTSVGSSDIEAFEFTITFNPELVNVSIGDQTDLLAENFNLTTNLVKPGELRIAGANTEFITETGALINLEVELLSGGISDIVLRDILINENGLAPVSGEVNVVLRRCGDVSGDTFVTALDASLVLQNSVRMADIFPLIELDSLAADVTGNGDISALDASRILQYEVGLLEKLDCISLPIKKAPEIVKADWSLTGSEDALNFVNLDFSDSEFDVFAIQLEFEISEGASFKKVNGVQDDWNVMMNESDGKTYISMYGVTPLETKEVKLEFENLNDNSSPRINAQLVLNESSFNELNELILKELPSEFTLNQNYPNPFNPTTNINYSLPENVNVQLTVFNMLGQKVATLVDQKQDAGVYTISWDASSVSSGVYLYQLKAGSTIFTKKMLLVK